MKNTIPAVERTLFILELLKNADNGISQQELIREAGISTTTGYRILQTLLYYQWVQRDENGLYHLTENLPKKETPFQKILKRAQTVLDELTAETHLSCKFSVREGNEQVSVLRSVSPAPFAVSGKAGARFPIIEGTAGAVLLSGEKETDICRTAAAETEDIPEKKNHELIFSKIQAVKKQGWVLNMKPGRWRVQTMSAPVCVNGTVCAAITLIGLPGDFSEAASTARKLIHAQQQLQKAGEIK